MSMSVRRSVSGLAIGLVFSLLTPLLPAHAQNAPAAALVIGTDQPETSFVGKWQRQIYAEAFKRIDLRAEFVTFPPPRLSVLVESGEVDGEMTRTIEYGAAHPTLVRADESVFSIVFAVYSAQPGVQADGLKAIPAGSVVEYRRGVLGCENMLKPLAQTIQLSDILTTEQGLKKLVSRRTDFYCDVDLAVLNEMSTAKASEFAAVRKMFNFSNTTPLYPYLNKKNAAIAPRLAAALKQMKAEGLIERYRRDAMREFGQI
jgi:polar amino acid transport system substrate-binding protein